METTTRTACANCGTHLHGPVCHNCGQKHIRSRWTLGVLIEQFFSQLSNIESGFIYTLHALISKPGELIQDYWRGKTKIYYNPFRFMIILVGFNLLLGFLIGVDDLMQATFQPEELEAQMGTENVIEADMKFDSWLNVLVLLLLPVHALSSRWLFGRHGKNYGEHLIANAYCMGQQAFLSSAFMLVAYVFPVLFIAFLPVNFVLGFVYNGYVFSQTFGEGKFSSFSKTFLQGILGLSVFFALLLIFSFLALFFTMQAT